MRLPNLSNMVYVGQLRHIQAAYEAPEHRNPDGLIRHFLSTSELWSCRLRGTLAIGRLRRNPFYYYVLARTRHYDRAYARAISDGVRHILNIGAGSDTRAYRYADQLREAKISCIECDQAPAIANKERLARSKLQACHVEYMPLDLNREHWKPIEAWLQRSRGAKALVMMEGVSPYIEEKAFTEFLSLLATRLPPGSRVVYDFKRKGVADGFGRAAAVKLPFRLPANAAAVAHFHQALGLRLEHMECAEDLVKRTVPGFTGLRRQAFSEDVLVELAVGESREDLA